MDAVNKSVRQVFRLNEQHKSKIGKWQSATAVAEVTTKHGEHLGKIKQIIGDLENDDIQYVVFQFRENLGLGKKNYMIPWSEFTVRETENRVNLDKDFNTIRNAPAFSDNNWPDENSYYFDDINRYWN